MGLREGGRGVRPDVRVLRHPVVPGQAAVARRRSRSSTRSTRLEVAEIVLVAQDLASYGRDVGRKGAIVPLVEAVAARVAPGAAAVPVPVGARRPAGRRHLRHRRALLRPVPPARVQAPAAADAAVGRRRAVPAADLVHPRPGARRPPSARRSSSATRARRRTTTTSCSGSSRTPSSTGPGSSPTRRRTAPTPPASTGRSTTALVAERLRELAELQDAHHHRPPGGAGGLDDRGPGRRAGRRPQPPGGARDRRGGRT